VLRDPYTNKSFVMFYATKRVGAGVLDPNAIRLLRIPAWGLGADVEPGRPFTR
jgi:predicted phage gp36 major capsid-like protein